MNHLIPENFNFSPGGPLNPHFLFADGIDLKTATRRKPAISEAERGRLVKASKSPTPEESMERGYKRALFEHRARVVAHCEPSPESAVIKDYEPQPVITPLNQVGAKTVIQFREWAEEWRIRTEAEPTSGMLPPDQSGDRESVMLSHRGARKIADSCEYMATCKGGYKTFVTGTFSPEARQRIESGETTIQREVSRTMDAMQKMYQRGWTMKNGTRVAGHEEGLCYCWVVEVPKNEDGADNPHIHMLLGWRVPFCEFEEWAERMEGLWSNGYFHLEKIKDSTCAGAYMAKAAGYLSKGQGNEDQGRVRGNRYGISEPARAPDWVTVSEKQLHVMGQLIADIYDHLTVKHGEKFRERKKLNERLAEVPKEAKWTRKKIGERLAKVRAELKQIPIRCNKYQLIIKGKLNAAQFFTWAQTPDNGRVQWPDWLPEKPHGIAWNDGDDITAADNQCQNWIRGVVRRFNEKRVMRRIENPPAWVQWCDEEWQQLKNGYEQLALYFSGEDLDLCQ